MKFEFKDKSLAANRMAFLHPMTNKVEEIQITGQAGYNAVSLAKEFYTIIKGVDPPDEVTIVRLKGDEFTQ